MKLYGTIVGASGVAQLLLDKGYVQAISPAPPDAAGEELLIAPGLVDIQINGYGGLSLGGPNARPDALPYMVSALRQAGVLFCCPTVTTDSQENLLRSLRILARAREDADIAHATPCIHLEGPYIGAEDGPRGAHPLEHVRPPDWEEFSRLQEAAHGAIGIVTLGIEQPGAIPFIERLAAAGIVAAIGHTGASPRQVADAVRAGARLSTHLGNGSHAKIDRHPNYIWEQMAADELSASIIADGHHLPPSVVKCMVRAKGIERTILVSDAVAAAGLPPGVYGAEGRDIEILPNGRVQLKGTPYLSGAGLLLLPGVENTVRFAGVSLADAIRMASANPARLLGLDNRIGAVAPGMEASLTLLRWNGETDTLAVEAVVVRGQMIRTAEMGDALRPAGEQPW